jgi:hypothetical protein
MTAHWINVDPDTGKWILRAEVVGFRLIHGTHAGDNLGRYFVGLCDRVGIMSRFNSKVSRYRNNMKDMIIRLGSAIYGDIRQHLIKHNIMRDN